MNSAKECRLERRRTAPHEGVIDQLAGPGEAFDKKARQLRLETGSIGNFMQTAGLPLTGRPEFVNERRDFQIPSLPIRELGGENSRRLPELVERVKFLGQRRMTRGSRRGLGGQIPVER